MTVTDQPAAQPKKKKRGTESAGDMVRSLGLVLAGVVVVWYFAQPPAADEQAIRVVDPTGDIAAFRADVPAAPVPGGLPSQWRPTSSTRTADPRALRIGYVTPAEQYAEYAASTGTEVLTDLTGDGDPLGPVDIDGVRWDTYRDESGSLSLSHVFGPVTVVIGTTRSTASLEELRVLVRSLRAG